MFYPWVDVLPCEINSNKDLLTASALKRPGIFIATTHRRSTSANMEVSRRRAALLAALCICAAACLPPPARAAAATTTSNTTTSAANATAPSRLINSTQCRWNAQLFTCELSPGFLVATFANSDAPLNAYAQGLVRAAAVELTCNQLANVSTCEADARCTYDSTVVSTPCTAYAFGGRA